MWHVWEVSAALGNSRCRCCMSESFWMSWGMGVSMARLNGGVARLNGGMARLNGITGCLQRSSASHNGGTWGGQGRRKVIGGEEGGGGWWGEWKGWENYCQNVATLCGSLWNDVISSNSDWLQPVLIGSEFLGLDGNQSWCHRDFDGTRVGSSVSISYFQFEFSSTPALESNF